MSDAQPLTGLCPGDIANHVFMCGDPDRVDRIAASWSNLETVCALREYRVLTGERDGVRLSVGSTGIGAPSTAILFEEFAKLGAHTFIRIGNCGGLDPQLELGDLAITTGSVRDDGTSSTYVIPEFPAIAHHDVVSGLVDASKAAGARHKTGVTWSLDAFYARNAFVDDKGAMTSMSINGYWPSHFETRIRDMQAANVLNCEMESGVTLTLATLFGLRAGCICVVSDRTPWPGPAELDLDNNMSQCIEVANQTLLSLARA